MLLKRHSSMSRIHYECKKHLLRDFPLTYCYFCQSNMMPLDMNFRHDVKSLVLELLELTQQPSVYSSWYFSTWYFDNRTTITLTWHWRWGS